MSESRAHRDTANRIARSHGTDYNRGKGPDILTPKVAIEVETTGTVRDGLRQLQGFKKPVFIAGANQKAVERALEITEGTTIGVMDASGKILKASTRRRGS